MIKDSLPKNDGSILKGSPHPSHFIFEINLGKSRIRHRTTLKLNFKIDSKSIGDEDIQVQSRSMSDPTLSDIDFKDKMAWVWSLDSGPPSILVQIHSVREAL